MKPLRVSKSKLKSKRQEIVKAQKVLANLEREYQALALEVADEIV